MSTINQNGIDFNNVKVGETVFRPAGFAILWLRV